MDVRALRLVALVSASLGVGLAGCGLKGPLTLPTRSDEVTIRGPGESSTTSPAAAATAPATGEQDGTSAAPSATSPATTPPTATPATPATAPTPARRRYDRLPPPPLPASNPGTSRGG
jgi:predicted small lipoprotein YifL